METKKPWWHDALYVFSKITGWIVGPVLIALFVGKYFDKKWGTEPYAFLGFTIFAFVISLIAMIKILYTHAKSLETKSPENPEQK